MIKDLQEFHYYVGETIMFCQCIEQDIKFIYAGMLDGDFDKNYEDIQKWTLGTTVLELENLDNCDNDPYLHKEDYALLKRITKIRNYRVHNAYVDFVYEKSNEKAFNKVSKRLENDHNRLEKIHKSVEKVRLDMLKDYGRI
jgi:hypothetical protein